MRPGSAARTPTSCRHARSPTTRLRRSRRARCSTESPFDALARFEELLAFGDGVLARAHRHVGVSEADRVALPVLACTPDRADGALDRERRCGRDGLRRPGGAVEELA